MDPERFETLLRTLARTHSRRAAFRLFVGSLALGTVVPLSPMPATAKTGKGKRTGDVRATS